MTGILGGLIASIGPNQPTISSLTFNAGGTQLTDGSTQTVTGLSIGTANANRYVAIVLRVRYSTAFSEDGLPASVTVGGQSCSVVAFVNNSGGTTFIGHAIYVTDEPVTSGTTADIVVTAPTGETLTSTFASSYSLITFGSKPRVIYTSFEVSSSSTGGHDINSPWQSGDFGIVAGAAATGVGLTNFTMSTASAATQDYSSGVSELGALITGTLKGEGDIEFTTTGAGSTTRIVMAIWK